MVTHTVKLSGYGTLGVRGLKTIEANFDKFTRNLGFNAVDEATANDSIITDGDESVPSEETGFCFCCGFAELKHMKFKDSLQGSFNIGYSLGIYHVDNKVLNLCTWFDYNIDQ